MGHVRCRTWRDRESKKSATSTNVELTSQNSQRTDISDALHTNRVAGVRPPIRVHTLEGDRERSIFFLLRPFRGSAGGHLCSGGAGSLVARHLVVARELFH